MQMITTFVNLFKTQLHEQLPYYHPRDLLFYQPRNVRTKQEKWHSLLLWHSLQKNVLCLNSDTASQSDCNLSYHCVIWKLDKHGMYSTMHGNTIKQMIWDSNLSMQPEAFFLSLTAAH